MLLILTSGILSMYSTGFSVKINFFRNKLRLYQLILTLRKLLDPRSHSFHWQSCPDAKTCISTMINLDRAHVIPWGYQRLSPLSLYSCNHCRRLWERVGYSVREMKQHSSHDTLGRFSSFLSIRRYFNLCDSHVDPQNSLLSLCQRKF